MLRLLDICELYRTRDTETGIGDDDIDMVGLLLSALSGAPDRLNSKTRQPRSAKSEAVALPIPLLPPEITSVFITPIAFPAHLLSVRER